MSVARKGSRDFADTLESCLCQPNVKQGCTVFVRKNISAQGDTCPGEGRLSYFQVSYVRWHNTLDRTNVPDTGTSK